MPATATNVGPTHIVSLIQGSHMPDTPTDQPGVRHLKIDVDDITEPMMGMILPPMMDVGPNRPPRAAIAKTMGTGSPNSKRGREP